MDPYLEGILAAQAPILVLSWRPFPRSPADKSVIPVKSRVIPGSPFGQVRPWEWPYLVVLGSSHSGFIEESVNQQ